MAEPAVDLRLVLSSLRRRWTALVATAVWGALLGMAAVYLWPPMYASSSLVLLPPKTGDSNQMAELVKTDVRIAMSDSVLGPAASSLRPPMSVQDLAQDVDVTAVTPLVLQIEGRAEQPQRAEDITAAVANADVAYVTGSLSSLSNARRAALAEADKELRAALKRVEAQIQATTARLRGEDPRSAQRKADATALARLTAQQGKLVLDLERLRSEADAALPSGGASVIQEPSPAERPGLALRFVGAMLIGALAAVLLTAGVITILTRRDPRLYFRDHISDAVGSPVIASVRSRPMRSVADWISLLHDYDPGVIDAWGWRRALRELGFSELSATVEHPESTRMRRPRSISVVTLSADARGLAMGPELAAYAASAGVRTRLVAGQRHESAAALWAACSRLAEHPSPRPGLSVEARHDDEPEADLEIVLMVLDRHEPKLLDVPADSVVVLALSAGSATAEQLARVAVTVDEAGQRIHGIIVADPSDLDRTTGRLPQHDRMRQAPLPMRLTGTPGLKGPRGTFSDPQRRQG